MYIWESYTCSFFGVIIYQSVWKLPKHIHACTGEFIAFWNCKWDKLFMSIRIQININDNECDIWNVEHR